MVDGSLEDWLVRIEAKLDDIVSMIGGADRRAENRSILTLGVAVMNTAEMARFVATQKGMTDGIAANRSLIERMLAEIRRVGEAGSSPMSPEISAALDGFEANVAALAAATAAGTQAFPADIPIPPVVPIESGMV
jgi:hypothetical protein